MVAASAMPKLPPENSARLAALRSSLHWLARAGGVAGLGESLGSGPPLGVVEISAVGSAVGPGEAGSHAVTPNNRADIATMLTIPL